MNEITREQGRLWQNIIGDQNDCDFNTIRRVLSQLIGALVEEPKPPAPPIVISRKPSAPYTQERAGYIPGIGGTCPYCGCDGMTVVDDKAVCWDCFLIMLWPPDKDEDKPEEPLLRNCIPDDPARQHNEPPAQPDEWREEDYAWWGCSGTEEDDGIVHLAEFIPSARDGYDMWKLDDGTGVFVAHLTVPTARQLARKLGEDEDGNDILAWACEMSNSDISIKNIIKVSQSNRLHAFGATRELVEAADIPIVTAGQCKRMFPEFPPEEAADAT